MVGRLPTEMDQEEELLQSYLETISHMPHPDFTHTNIPNKFIF